MMLTPIGDAGGSPGFDQFYSLYLLRSPGARVRSTALRELYLDYCASTGAAVLGFKPLARLLKDRGHRMQRSNQVYYCDLTIVRRVEGVPFDPAMLTADRVVAVLDAAISDLQATRDRLMRDLGAVQGIGSVVA